VVGLVGATLPGHGVGNDGLQRQRPCCAVWGRIYGGVIRNSRLLAPAPVWYFVFPLLPQRHRGRANSLGWWRPSRALSGRSPRAGLQGPQLVNGDLASSLAFLGRRFAALLTGLNHLHRAFVAEVVRGGIAAGPAPVGKPPFLGLATGARAMRSVVCPGPAGDHSRLK